MFENRAIFAVILNQCIYELLCIDYLERGDVIEIDTKVM